MLRPTKYMDANTCVLRIASEILSEFKKAPIISLEECDELVRDRAGDDARFNFISALNFLFLIGCLEYNSDSDVLVYRLSLGQESQAL